MKANRDTDFTLIASVSVDPVLANQIDAASDTPIPSSHTVEDIKSAQAQDPGIADVLKFKFEGTHPNR